jgi:hypothetical protein
MKRSDCYLTFTEALERYLLARDAVIHHPEGSREHAKALDELEVAREHMEALTS